MNTERFEHSVSGLMPQDRTADKRKMIMKHLHRAVVCWPTITTNVVFDDARVIEAGETVCIVEAEEQPESPRLPIWVGSEKLFCNPRQFWAAAK